METETRGTRLLNASAEGDLHSQEELISAVYDEVRRLAASYMRQERPNHTLQATALVHEAYLRLIGQETTWRNRSHFLGVAAHQMRRILLDHARRRRTAKRGGEYKMSFRDAIALALERPDRLVALDDALEQFARGYPRQARVVELRFFGGSTEEETSEMLGFSRQTVHRDWQFSRAWLSRAMGAS